MAKKKKHILTFEQDFDFEMLGLCTHHSDYRLAWGINNGLDLKLTKSDDDYVVTNKKDEPVSKHSVYTYTDEENRVDFFLIKNKSFKHFLIPEKPTIDYFLFLYNNNSVEMDDLIEDLKSIPSVLAAYHFLPEEIASAESLVLY